MKRNSTLNSDSANQGGHLVPVVLVEDDRFFGDYVESVLQASGRFRLIARATSVEDALAWPLAPEPALLLLDVVLHDGPPHFLAGCAAR